MSTTSEALRQQIATDVAAVSVARFLPNLPADVQQQVAALCRDAIYVSLLVWDEHTGPQRATYSIN